jgi:ferredoxin
MADPRRSLPENVAGDFFVDDSCIDCDTCRQVAPATFRDHGASMFLTHRDDVGDHAAFARDTAAGTMRRRPSCTPACANASGG